MGLVEAMGLMLPLEMWGPKAEVLAALLDYCFAR